MIKIKASTANSQTRTKKNQNQVHNETSKVAEYSKEPSPADTVLTINDDDETDETFQPQKRPSKQLNRYLTFIIGSCILKHIEARFLTDNVKVKGFIKAKIKTLEENLTKMDPSRYDNISLHIGGHDVDAKVGPAEFKFKYQSLLLNSLTDKICKLFVSGL